MKCPFCGNEFREEDTSAACGGCITANGCHMLKCPNCGYAESKVIDSRDLAGGVRRRRECLRCRSRFTTYERVQPTSFFVLKKDGRR